MRRKGDPQSLRQELAAHCCVALGHWATAGRAAQHVLHPAHRPVPATPVQLRQGSDRLAVQQGHPLAKAQSPGLRVHVLGLEEGKLFGPDSGAIKRPQSQPFQSLQFRRRQELVHLRAADDHGDPMRLSGVRFRRVRRRRLVLSRNVAVPGLTHRSPSGADASWEAAD